MPKPYHDRSYIDEGKAERFFNRSDPLHLRLDPGQLGGWLLSKHRIVSTPIVHAEFKGIRVTPSIYTAVDEIDTFVEAVTKAIRTGIA